MAENMEIEDRIRIGKRLMELREGAGMTQEELSEVTGLDRANISKIERGRYNVGLDILSKLARALGCEVDIVGRD